MSNVAPIPKELSSKISNMSFVCACLVVSMHIWPHPTSGIAGVLDKMFYGGISKIAVPIFFCISGYLIAQKIAAGNWKREITKRIGTLVIPFYFWGTFSCLMTFIESLVFDIERKVFLGTSFWEKRTPMGVFIDLTGFNLIEYPYCMPLWFLRNLFFLVLVSPFICSLVRRYHWIYVGSLFMFLCIYGEIAHGLPKALTSFLSVGFSLYGLTAFSLGMLLRLRDYHFGNTTITAILMPFVVVGWGVISFVHPIDWLMPVFILMGSFFIWQLVPTHLFPRFMTQANFSIYLVHSIFLSIFQLLQMFPRYFPCSSSLIGFLIQWGGALVLSIVFSMMMHRFLPKTAYFVFGGR